LKRILETRKNILHLLKEAVVELGIRRNHVEVVDMPHQLDDNPSGQNHRKSKTHSFRLFFLAILPTGII